MNSEGEIQKWLTMNHADLLTNQELLKELERRLPNFNKDELIFLGRIMTKQIPEKAEILEFLKEKYPETYNLFQKPEQKEKEEAIEKIKEAVKKFKPRNLKKDYE